MTIKERDTLDGGVGGDEAADEEDVDKPLSGLPAASVSEIDPAENIARAPSKKLKSTRKSVRIAEPPILPPGGYAELESLPHRVPKPATTSPEKRLFDLAALEARERADERLLQVVTGIGVALGIVAGWVLARKFQGKPLCPFSSVPPANSCPAGN